MAFTCARGSDNDCAQFVQAASEANLSLSLQQMHTLLRLAGGLFVVAYRGGEAAGCLLGQQLLGTCEVFDLLVLQRFRRQGCGEALLQHVVAHEVNRPSRMLVEVADDNLAARALYAKAHFTPIGLRKDYYARTPTNTRAAAVDAHVLERLCP